MKMDPSIYRKIVLDDNNLWIRLFILSPGPPSAQLSGTLIHAKSDDEWKTQDIDSFEALSYTWGTSAHKGPVTINNRPCLVGANLYAALLALRYEKKARVLWIDAICINQDDVEEKNMHVPLMHLVYQGASRVVIWLGRAFEGSDSALSHLDILWETEDVDGFVARLKSTGATDSDVANGTIWKPLSRLFSLPWWSRMWVLQEAYFANPSESIVVCGNETRPWASIIIASSILMDGEVVRRFSPRMPPTVYAGLFRSTAATLIDMRASKMSKTLWETLQRISRTRLATDPRDKIFALLNLLDRDEWPFEPDYSVDAVEMYTKVAVHFINKTNSLTILSECAFFDGAREDLKFRKELRRQHLAGLPSWVPDWTLIKLTPPFRVAEQQPRAEPIPFRIEQDRILVVRGLISETIISIDGTQFRQITWGLPTIGTEFGMEGLFQAVQSVRADLKQTDDQVDVEWDLLIGEDNETPGFSKVDYARYRQGMSPEPNQLFYNIAFRRTMSRRIAATSRGRLALVPETAEIGDCVAFIIGAPSAVLLRPIVPEKTGSTGTRGVSVHYTVIEEAYVQNCSVEGVLGQARESIHELRLK